MWIRAKLLFVLASIGAMHSFITAVAEAQLGCTRAQAEKWLVLEEEDDDDLFLLGDGAPTQFVAHPIGKAEPKFIISFLNDKAVAIRPQDTLDLKLKDVLAGLNTFNFRMQGDERKPVQWQATHAFITAYPPVGESSTNVMPLTKTIGQQRTVSFNANTGEVLGASPWSDLSVPTGRFLSYESGSSCSVDTLVSNDGELYARLVTYSSRVGSSSSSRIDQFVICDATYFWMLSTQLIGHGYRSMHEHLFNKFVPEDLQPKARRGRQAAMFTGLASTSALTPKELAELAKGVEAPRTNLLASLSHLLHKQPPAAQKRRMEVLAELFGPESISALMPMRRQPGDVGEKAMEVLRQIAADHDLSDPPGEKATTTEWAQWAKQFESE